MANLEDTLQEIQLAEQEGDRLKQARASSRAGQIYLERNLYREAANHYQQAGRLYASLGQSLSRAQALNRLGVCQVMADQASEALESLHLALDCLEEDPDADLESAVKGNLGLAYSALKDYQNAYKSHKEVLEAAEDRGDDLLRLNALINLADCQLLDRNYRSAQGFALVALDLARQLDPHPGLTIIYDLLGMISSRLGDLRAAVEYHEQAYQDALERKDLLRQGIALANQGLALEGLTELERAAELMEKAEGIFMTLNSDYRAKTHRDLERIRQSLSP